MRMYKTYMPMMLFVCITASLSPSSASAQNISEVENALRNACSTCFSFLAENFLPSRDCFLRPGEVRETSGPGLVLRCQHACLAAKNDVVGEQISAQAAECLRLLQNGNNRGLDISIDQDQESY